MKIGIKSCRNKREGKKLMKFKKLKQIEFNTSSLRRNKYWMKVKL